MSQFGIGLGLAGPPALRQNAARYGPLARDYFARLDAANLRVNAYDAANARLIDRLVSNGGNFWPDSGAFCAMAGYLFPPDDTLIPLKDGHDAGTLKAFVTGDWNAVTGLKGNGSTKYVDSNRAADVEPLNDISAGVYISAPLSANEVGQSVLGSREEASSAFEIFTRELHYYIRNRSHADRAGSDPGVTDSYTGYLGTSRSNSSDFLIRDNDTDTTQTLSSGATNPYNIYVFARNDSGTGFLGTRADFRLPFYHIGPNLSGAGELAELDSILTDWQTDLAAA